ncbi:hypothetical protein Mal15_41490 [Stieleria maiorica]|uniref:Uncharacterized protein n=1 Tax=Stieleria maiorica TaxID=2795974 RepID=A0A5B9MHV5_9BACT|nr:hypothetical protein [Stieleria maiorica]QEG00080.1 hypothetical protein Mal15_41490 [Stieleria maiorica]
MARRKLSRKTPRGPSPQQPDGSIDPAGTEAAETPQQAETPLPAESTAVATPRPPSPFWVGLISAAIVVHLLALFVSYSALIEPSSTHSSLLDLASPYLRSTHFSADGRRFYLAHATPDEQPHRLQFASAGKDGDLVIDRQTEWTTVQPGGIAGLAASDRYGRWMALAATLAQSDRPSLAAALLMPLISADPSIDAVRVVRLPTQLTTVADDSAPPVYLARVVRSGDQVRLVSIGAKRLSTYARDPETGAETEADAAANAPVGEAAKP